MGRRQAVLFILTLPVGSGARPADDFEHRAPPPSPRSLCSHDPLAVTAERQRGPFVGNGVWQRPQFCFERASTR